MTRATRGKTRAGRLRLLDAVVLERERALCTRRDGVWADAPVLDVGFGQHPWTTMELADALTAACAGSPPLVVGAEHDPERLEAAQQHARPGVRFVSHDASLPPARLIRAMNVLRQYPIEEVGVMHEAWGRLLAPGGLLVEGTCDRGGDVLTAHLLRREGAGGMRREALVFCTSFARGFAPIQLRDYLPRDLRRRVHEGAAITRFMESWTGAWQDVRQGCVGEASLSEVFVMTARTLASRREGISWQVMPDGAALIWAPPGGVPRAE